MALALSLFHVAGCASLLGISDLPGLDGGIDATGLADGDATTIADARTIDADVAMMDSTDGSDASVSRSDAGDAGVDATSDSSNENADAEAEAGSAEAAAEAGEPCATTGTMQCSGNGVETCGSDGQWGAVSPCPSPANLCMGAGICTCPCSTATAGTACANALCNYDYPGDVCALSGMPDPPAYCTPP